MSNRIETVIEFLKDGQSFYMENLAFEMEGRETVVVIGWSAFINLTNLTKQAAIKEFNDIKSTFNKILEDSQNFRNFIANKSIKYKLCFDDGGKASIDICSEKNGVINWLIDLR